MQVQLHLEIIGVLHCLDEIALRVDEEQARRLALDLPAEDEGAARVDFRITPRGRAVVLEINTVPGMTEKSLLPMAAARAEIDYDELTEQILESALVRAARSTRPSVEGSRP